MDSALDTPPPRSLLRAVTMTGRGGPSARRAADRASLGCLISQLLNVRVAGSDAPSPAHSPNFDKLPLRLCRGSGGGAWGALSPRFARWAPWEVEVARPRERPPGGGVQNRYGACVRLGVRRGKGFTACETTLGEASNPEVGRHGAGPTSGIWGAKIAPQEAGRCTPPPSSKLMELAKVALSWDVSKGGVSGTEPLGEVAASSLGSEGLSPAALILESPVTTMGESEIPGGGPISEERGSRLRETTAGCSRRPGGSLAGPEDSASFGTCISASAAPAEVAAMTSQKLGPEAMGQGSLPVELLWNPPRPLSRVWQNPSSKVC